MTFPTSRLTMSTAMMAAALTAAPLKGQVIPGPGTAAEPETSLESADSEIADIVITGRKRARSETLQSVPLSITALGAAQLAEPIVATLIDVGRLTPNASLQTSSQRGIQNFSIRGMGISGSTPSDEPAVGVFQDGVYWGSNYGALSDLFDLEGVEILRGPQGTLFGRNVTGGAIAVRSARPASTPYSRVSVGVGNGGLFEASAVTNARTSATLSARIAVQARTGGNLFHNTLTDSGYGRSNSYLLRPSLRWRPTSNLDVTVLGEYYNEYGAPAIFRGRSPRLLTQNPVTLAEQEGFLTPRRFFDVNPNDPGFSNVEVWFGMLEANWNVGPGVLTSVSGLRQVKARVRADIDGSPSQGFLQGILNDQDQVSSELRYAADISNWLSFTTGIYYFDQSFNFRENRRLNNNLTVLASRSLLDNESYAAFAEADIKPFAGFSITAGGRYTHENKVARSAPFGACDFAFSTCRLSLPRDYSEGKFTPKVGISYQLAPTALLFGSATRGFRAGGFSLRGTTLIEPYKAETVTAYEAGLKTDLFNRRFRFNVSAYYNTYKDLQRTVLGTSPTQGIVQAVFNAADANIKGGEVELTAIVVPGFTLSGNYGYTDANYKSFAGVANPEDREFVRVPKHTFNVSAEYERRLQNGDRLNARVTAAYTGRYYFDDPNLLSQKGYALVDTNFAYTLNSGLTLAVYGKNLFNTEYSNWGSSLGALGENLLPGNPRSYGARMSAQF
jgi:iron complex outermembrane receptor protein